MYTNAPMAKGSTLQAIRVNPFIISPPPYMLQGGISVSTSLLPTHSVYVHVS